MTSFPRGSVRFGEDIPKIDVGRTRLECDVSVAVFREQTVWDMSLPRVVMMSGVDFVTNRCPRRSSR